MNEKDWYFLAIINSAAGASFDIGRSKHKKIYPNNMPNYFKFILRLNFLLPSNIKAEKPNWLIIFYLSPIRVAPLM